MATDIPTIPEFYRGRKVLVTGGTGFMGKVLIEKLLRSCPDIDTVYLLLRAKKGKDAQARLSDVTGKVLFDRIKEENPAALSKLVAVGGDVKELGLGLSEEDRRLLQDSVSVVFHSAASVRFDDPIRDAVLVNVRGTRELVELALGMRNLKAFVHVSTMYCNFDRHEVDEQLYPPPSDWRKAIAVAECEELRHLLPLVTPKILGKLPNTYTYAKALSEHVIGDYKDRLPVVIVRPSVVTGAIDEPMTGWIDVYSGAFGFMTAVAKGMYRVMYGDPQILIDCVPVDVAIKAIIFLAYNRGTKRLEKNTVEVFNCCSLVEPFTLQQFGEVGVVIARELPMEDIPWYPTFVPTYSKLLHYLATIVFNILPALLYDAVLKLTGREPRITKIQRSIYIAGQNVVSFLTKPITFRNDRMLAIQDEAMITSDLKDFGYNKILTNLAEYMMISAVGVRKYLLKESDTSIESCKGRMVRLYWIHHSAKFLFFLLLFWMLGACSKIRSLPSFITS